MTISVLLSAAAIQGQTKFTERSFATNCADATFDGIGDEEPAREKSDESPCRVAHRGVHPFRRDGGLAVTGKREGESNTSRYFKTKQIHTDSRSAIAENDPQAQAEDAQELAKKLSNPIASLISFPFQSNFDFGMGPERKGYRYTLNIQPVIPFALTKDINLISRTILPVIAQEDVVGSTGQGGLGDTIQSFFFSPNKVEPFIWGVGPQLLIPTGTNQYLGSQKFGMGPTFVILKQQKAWTYGTLVNHTWSVFGKDTRPPVNTTFLQPFLAYTTKNAWTFTFNTESAYDWSGDAWNVPIHFQVSKLIRVGKQPISVGIASRCWAVSGPGGPQGCGFRLVFVPLFPVK